MFRTNSRLSARTRDYLCAFTLARMRFSLFSDVGVERRGSQSHPTHAPLPVYAMFVRANFAKHLCDVRQRQNLLLKNLPEILCFPKFCSRLREICDATERDPHRFRRERFDHCRGTQIGRALLRNIYQWKDQCTFANRRLGIAGARRGLHNAHRNCLSGSADAHNRFDEVPSSFPSYSLHTTRL